MDAHDRSTPVGVTFVRFSSRCAMSRQVRGGKRMKVTKAAREALRKELVGKGYAPDDIALVMIAKYRVRPRVAFRWRME